MSTHQFRRALAALGLAAIAVVGAACSGAPADTPAGVVREAMDLLEAKDLDGLSNLACAAERDRIRDQLSFGANQLGALAPGLEVGDFLGAVDFDVDHLTITETGVEGDRATVRMTGTMGMSLDPDRIRELMRSLMEQQGMPVDESTLDLIVGQLSNFVDNVPVDQTLVLVREDGAWRICGQG